ncbi:MAG: hypothetical protein KDA32_06100 [Phycisphaerales bacterium]|nr:hypothetical protein [Phycisphaerales bacterium]
MDSRDNLENDMERTPRPYIGVMFECCGVYQRVYRRPDQLEYRGRCPRCLRLVNVRVDPSSGSNERIFRAR